jgi:hypothetical protein
LAILKVCSMSQKKEKVTDIVKVSASPAPSCGEILDAVEVGRRLKIPAKTDTEMTRKVYELTRKRGSRLAS